MSPLIRAQNGSEYEPESLRWHKTQDKKNSTALLLLVPNDFCFFAPKVLQFIDAFRSKLKIVLDMCEVDFELTRQDPGNPTV